MRIIYKTCFLLLSVMAARAAFGQVAAVPDAEELRRPFGADDISNFRTPPRINYPQTWFHFIGGNVSAEGITEALAAIAGAGISGVGSWNIAACISLPPFFTFTSMRGQIVSPAHSHLV